MADFILDRISNYLSNLPKKGKENVLDPLLTSKPMPPIKTRGNKIVRTDTNEEITLKGAASDVFRFVERYKGKVTVEKDEAGEEIGRSGEFEPFFQSTDDLLKRMKMISDWGGNLITFWVVPLYARRQMDLMDKAVEFGEKNDLYINFMPITNMTERDRGSPYDTENDTFMQELANRYREKPNVIYGLGAEPFNIKWEDWVKRASEIAEKIRKINPDATLVMPGVDWGRTLKLEEKPFPFQNVIYAVGDYPFADKSDYEIKGKNLDLIAWKKPEYLKYPVLITEMGGFYGKDFDSEEDLEVLKHMFNDGRNRKFSYQIHNMDSTSKIGLIKYDYS